MRSRIDVEVEPLSDQRWAKVERGIFSRLEAATRPEPPAGRGRPPWTWLAAAAAVVLAVAGGVVASSWKTERGFASPSRISTGNEGSHLALKHASVDVRPNSAVVVDGNQDLDVHLILDRGTIACDVEPHVAGFQFMVQAGEVSVRVVGTRFTVTRISEAVRIDVDRGVVEVGARGRYDRVRAGETWPTAPQLLDGSTVGDPSARPTARDRADPSPSRAERVRDEPPGAPSVPRPSGRTRTTTLSPPEPADSASRAVSPPLPPTRPTSQELYESAAKLEPGSPSEALSIYRRVAVGDDSWAQNALFAEGRLEAERGRTPSAKRLLSEYLTRFPHGANAADARSLLEQLH
jgi:FecR protein